MDLHHLFFCCGIECPEFSFRIGKILRSVSELPTAARLAIALRVLVQVCSKRVVRKYKVQMLGGKMISVGWLVSCGKSRYRKSCYSFVPFERNFSINGSGIFWCWINFMFCDGTAVDDIATIRIIRTFVLFCSIFILLSRENDGGPIFWMNLHPLKSCPFPRFSVVSLTSCTEFAACSNPPSRDNHRKAPYPRTQQRVW